MFPTVVMFTVMVIQEKAGGLNAVILLHTRLPFFLFYVRNFCAVIIYNKFLEVSLKKSIGLWELLVAQETNDDSLCCVGEGKYLLGKRLKSAGRFRILRKERRTVELSVEGLQLLLCRRSMLFWLIFVLFLRRCGWKRHFQNKKYPWRKIARVKCFYMIEVRNGGKLNQRVTLLYSLKCHIESETMVKITLGQFLKTTDICYGDLKYCRLVCMFLTWLRMRMSPVKVGDVLRWFECICSHLAGYIQTWWWFYLRCRINHGVVRYFEIKTTNWVFK